MNSKGTEDGLCTIFPTFVHRNLCKSNFQSFVVSGRWGVNLNWLRSAHCNALLPADWFHTRRLYYHYVLLLRITITYYNYVLQLRITIMCYKIVLHYSNLTCYYYTFSLWPPDGFHTRERYWFNLILLLPARLLLLLLLLLPGPLIISITITITSPLIITITITITRSADREMDHYFYL